MHTIAAQQVPNVQIFINGCGVLSFFLFVDSMCRKGLGFAERW